MDRRYALTATMDTLRTGVRRMATTGQTGLPAECSSGPVPGMDMAVAGVEAITAVAITAVVAIGVVVAGAMVAQVMVAITAAEAMATVADTTADGQPTVVAVMPGAATAPALAGSTAAAVVASTAVAVDTAAAIANGLASSATATSPRFRSWACPRKRQLELNLLVAYAGSDDEYTTKASASRTADVSCGWFRSGSNQTLPV